MNIIHKINNKIKPKINVGDIVVLFKKSKRGYPGGLEIGVKYEVINTNYTKSRSDVSNIDIKAIDKTNISINSLILYNLPISYFMIDTDYINYKIENILK